MLAADYGVSDRLFEGWLLVTNKAGVASPTLTCTVVHGQYGPLVQV